MDLDKLERRVIETARGAVPSDAVPYAFEKRVMAQIRGRLAEDPWNNLARALWRAAAPCVGITVLLAAWTILEPDFGSPANDLSQDFENTVMAAVVQDTLTAGAYSE